MGYNVWKLDTDSGLTWGGYCLISEGFVLWLHKGEERNRELYDFKFFTFNGKAKFYKVDFDRFTNHRANYYDLRGKLLPFGEARIPPNKNRVFPYRSSFKKMVELAELLAKGHKFLRVDFYDINGDIFFGETTFFPASGFGKLIPGHYDEVLGNMLNLD